MDPNLDSKQRYVELKKRLKHLLHENESYKQEIAKVNERLLNVSKDKAFLLEQLLQFEDNDSSTESELSDSDQDKKPPEPPKKKARQRKPKVQPALPHASNSWSHSTKGHSRTTTSIAALSNTNQASQGGHSKSSKTGAGHPKRRSKQDKQDKQDNQSRNAHHAGQQSAGQQAAGQQTAGQHTAGQHTAGQQTAGQQTAGQQTAVQQTAVQQTVVQQQLQHPNSAIAKTSTIDTSTGNHLTQMAKSSSSASIRNTLTAEEVERHLQAKGGPRIQMPLPTPLTLPAELFNEDAFIPDFSSERGNL